MRKTTARLAAVLAGCLAGSLGTTAAEAAITAPAPDSVQRGDVAIQDDRGYLLGNGCAFISPGLSGNVEHVVTVTNASTGAEVFRQRSTPSLTLSTSGDRFKPMSTTWATKGVPNGTYRIKSVATDRVKPAGSTTCRLQTSTLSEHTFELRQWQHRFDDARGQGTVSFNTSPKEWQLQLRDGSSTGVRLAGDELRIVRMPKDQGPLLPSDPAGCLTSAESCLPETPVSCEQSPDDCEERFVVLTAAYQGKAVRGLFDLRTKAFSAIGSLNGKTVVLSNVGDSCGEIRRKLAASGADPDAALAREPVVVDVPVDGGGPREVRTTAQKLCEFAQALAVELATTTDRGTGVLGTPEAAAGLVIHFYVNTTSGSPAAPSALGYEISRSDTVPEIPGLPALPALPAPELPVPAVPGADVPSDPTSLLGLLAPTGKLLQVKGEGYDSGTHVTGALNADTAPDAPDYPIWLPLLTAGTKPDTQLDFVGYGTATQDQTCFTLLGTQTCVGIGVLVGNGASLFGPTPVKLPLVP